MCVIEKKLKIVSKIRVENFVRSTGWQMCFKKQHNKFIQKIWGKNVDISVNEVNDWKNILLIIISEYE